MGGGEGESPPNRDVTFTTGDKTRSIEDFLKMIRTPGNFPPASVEGFHP